MLVKPVVDCCFKVVPVIVPCIIPLATIKVIELTFIPRQCITSEASYSPDFFLNEEFKTVSLSTALCNLVVPRFIVVEITRTFFVFHKVVQLLIESFN